MQIDLWQLIVGAIVTMATVLVPAWLTFRSQMAAERSRASEAAAAAARIAAEERAAAQSEAAAARAANEEVLRQKAKEAETARLAAETALEEKKREAQDQIREARREVMSELRTSLQELSDKCIKLDSRNEDLERKLSLQDELHREERRKDRQKCDDEFGKLHDELSKTKMKANDLMVALSDVRSELAMTHRPGGRRMTDPTVEHVSPPAAAAPQPVAV